MMAAANRTARYPCMKLCGPQFRHGGLVDHGANLTKNLAISLRLIIFILAKNQYFDITFVRYSTFLIVFLNFLHNKVNILYWPIE